MKGMPRVDENIVRLTIPYKDIFTTVYVVKSPQGIILFDTADNDRDVDEDIVPLLEQLGVGAEELKYIFISHNHRDHAGGLERVLHHFPHACVLTRSDGLREKHPGAIFCAPEDGETLLGGLFRVVTIPGHTADSMALLDIRTKTLITGDCLQLYGIFGSTDWACAIYLPTEHLQAVEKVRGMDVKCILTAHDYHPFGFCYRGREAVTGALDICVAPLLQIRDLIRENPQLDDAAIRLKFNELDKRPTVNTRVVAAMRKAMDEGGI